MMTRERKPITFGKEQMRFLAVALDQLESLKAQREGLTDAPPVQQRVVLLHGPGGAGKTEVLNIVREVAERFFGSSSHMFMASSNSAAAGIGGDTIHSSVNMNTKQKFEASALEFDPTTPAGQALVDKWADVSVLVVDEISLVSPAMLGGLSYRVCCARESRGADKDFFATKGEVFGRVPLVVFSGDFMQLAPFEGYGRRASLMADPRPQPNDQSQRARSHEAGGFHGTERLRAFLGVPDRRHRAYENVPFR